MIRQRIMKKARGAIMKKIDMVIIGGGSAGMSAAVAAREQGIQDILILERSEELGGILQQCIHNGFGLQMFKEELSGPMYAQRFIDQIEELQIDYKLNTTVLTINQQRQLQYVNEEEGYTWIQAGVILLASGCYERNRGAISIPGKRLPGVYTAGSAQRFLNLENIRVGKRVFILGSGDIGLIMARRMRLEGAEVAGVAELMPYSNGLMRNIVQCLRDFDIPLYLSHTVVDIQGKDHVEAVVIAKVDEHLQPIPGSEQRFAVDTLLLSIGLIPENELGYPLGMELDPKTKGAKVDQHYQTSIPHIYACGNALHVHDIVDFVTMESMEAGRCAAADIKQLVQSTDYRDTKAEHGVSYVLPQRIAKNVDQDITLCFRVVKPYRACEIRLYDDVHEIKCIKKRYLLPAEMERIQLKQGELSQLVGALHVEVREA